MTPSRSVRARFLLIEILTSLLERPVRSGVTLVAFVLGSAGLVAAMTVGGSAANAVRAGLTPAQLDSLRLRGTATAPLTARDAHTAARLERVRAAGVETLVSESPEAVTRLGPRVPSGARSDAQVVAAGSAYLDAVLARTRPAQARTQLGSTWSSRVALVGADTAADLRIRGPAVGTKVWVGDTDFDVVGIITGAERDDSLRRTVLVAPSALDRLAGVTSPPVELAVLTEPGYSAAVARALPSTLRPVARDSVTVSSVLDLDAVRRGVTTTISAALGWLALVVSLLTAVTVGTTTLLSVMARRSEIGLRRSLGATRTEVGALFIGEGLLLGVVGGIVGDALGVLGGTLIARSQNWVPVVGTASLLLGLLSAVAVAAVACALPSWRAAGTAPALAVRME